MKNNTTVETAAQQSAQACKVKSADGKDGFVASGTSPTTHQPTLDNVLARLKNFKRSGKGYTAQCPAHDDKRNSLSVSTGDNERILLKCHAGCSYEQVAAELGINSANARRASLKEYKYVDESGELLYQVCRTEPKSFFQRRPDGRGGWINNLEGVRRVLYRLPQLLAADEQATVFIVEGEKDADRLASLEFVATTNASGAGKWRDEYNEHLRGRHIAILPDNDDVGRSHAAQVANALKGMAASVKVIELPNLPEKGDVSDYLNAGGTHEQLQAIVENASDYLPSTHPRSTTNANPQVTNPVTSLLTATPTKAVKVVCMADVQAESVEWLWFPYIPLGKVSIVEGDGGVGKSFALCAVAAALSRGFGLPNVERTEPRKVLMLSTEDGLRDTMRPRLDSMNADVNLIFAVDGVLILNDAGLQKLENYIAEYNPALVIIDPLFAFTGAKMDVYRDNEVRGLMTPLTKLAEHYKCAIVAVRHLTKSATKAGYAGSGSVAFGAAVRSVLLFGQDSEGNRGFVQTKNNLARYGGAIGYEIEDERFRWLGECDLTADKILALPSATTRGTKVETAEDFLLEVLGDGAADSSDVECRAKAEGISPRTLDRAKKKLDVRSKRIGGKWLMELPARESQECQQECKDAISPSGGVLGADDVKSVTPLQHTPLEQSEPDVPVSSSYAPEGKNAAKGACGILGGVGGDAGILSREGYGWLERAAIMEYDGGLSRADAERSAKAELRKEQLPARADNLMNGEGSYETRYAA